MYCYLGIYEADSFKTQMVKDRLITDYKKDLEKYCNLTCLAKTLCRQLTPMQSLHVLRYSGGLIHWTKQDLYSLDVLTRKQLTLHRAFNQKGDVDRLYILRSLGGRGLLSIEDSIVGEERSLSAYMSLTPEPLLKLVKTYTFPCHQVYLAMNIKRVSLNVTRSYMLLNHFMDNTGLEPRDFEWSGHS